MSESRTGGLGCWPATSGRAVPVSDASASVVVSVTGEVLAPPWGRGLAVAESRAPEHAAEITATNASVRTFCKCMVSIVWTGVVWNLITGARQIVTRWSVYIWATMRRLSLLSLTFIGACALPPPPPPLAEFLVSAGDQTYWVQSNHLGLKIRGSPLILARTGGRYYELYVAEVDRSFPRALFAAERVFRRELATGDSAVIFEDSAILAMAADYRRRHPNQMPLGPTDEPDEEVEIAAVGE